MARRRLRPWLATLLLAAAPVAADYPLTILELHHRLLVELIPQLTPLAGPDGVVTGANDVLLVRAADIRGALARLDRIDTGIGFTATPRLVGERVVIDIHQRDAAWDQGSVTGGSVQTQVSSPLGAWLPLGGTHARDEGTARDISSVGAGSRETVSTLELRMTALD